jgi:indolepyruvate ferredoxin oxidoreductase alpha subunit
MKQLLTGNEAISRGAFEAGVVYASAYPGTPSTEILENIAAFKDDIIAEWAPNEKVALETAIGASIAGVRSIAAMKMVGVNVAADPLFSFSYAGVGGGMVLVSADDPGMHSSQNEQDNRYYAKFAKLAMLEPSDSQEAKDMTIAAFEISETFDTPVLMRVTTRICHSKSLVALEERKQVEKKPYTKNLPKYDLVPAVSRQLRVKLQGRIEKLSAFAEETPLNFVEWNDRKVGVITSGIAYQYAREVFGGNASYLKLGFTFPLPSQKIRDFAAQVETLYIVEELEPYIEEHVRSLGINCIGKEKIPYTGELNPDIIAKALLGQSLPQIEYDASVVAGRPPTLCSGCPHRAFFVELIKRKDIVISGDIGCYGLGGADPLNAKDMGICMGASISMGHGAQKIFTRFNENKRIVSIIGDSTFLHTGLNSLMHVAYNRSNTVTCILDNRITGMTGHQENPGTGLTLQGQETSMIDLASLVKSLGISQIRTVNPLKLSEMKETLDWAFAQTEPAVIITRWPCVLKKFTLQEKQEFGTPTGRCVVNADACIGCRVCIRTGCPSLCYDKKENKVSIDAATCVGCEVCLQVCPVKAIRKEGN